MDNSAILVEARPDDEPEEAPEAHPISGPKAQASDNDIQHIDDSANIRTVIVNTSTSLETFERFQINIDWTLQHLHDYLVEKMRLQGNYRMRNLTYKRIFSIEELSIVLRTLPDFLEGGARVQMEEGKYPSLHQVAIKVAFFGKLEDQREYYFPSNTTIQDV